MSYEFGDVVVIAPNSTHQESLRLLLDRALG
jgi:hypothetical protein